MKPSLDWLSSALRKRLLRCVRLIETRQIIDVTDVPMENLVDICTLYNLKVEDFRIVR